MRAFGYMENHADVASAWTMAVVPPRLYVQVAVIENIGGSGATYTLSGFFCKVFWSGRHADGETVDISSVFWKYAPDTIGKGDKIVIPLALQFRPTLEVGPLDVPVSAPSNEAERSVVDFLRGKRANDVVEAGELQKLVSSFLPARSPSQARSYFFGDYFKLEAMEVEQQRVALRPYDPNNLFIVAGFDGGSCPTLYYTNGDGNKIRKTTFLRSALGSQMSEGESYVFPLGTRKIIIAEEEPETTTLEWMKVTFVTPGKIPETIFE